MDALDKNFAKIAGFQASLIGPGSAVGQGLFSQLTGKPENPQMKLGLLKPVYEDIKNRLNLKGTNVVEASSVDRNRISSELDKYSIKYFPVFSIIFIISRISYIVIGPSVIFGKSSGLSESIPTSDNLVTLPLPAVKFPTSSWSCMHFIFIPDGLLLVDVIIKYG